MITVEAIVVSCMVAHYSVGAAQGSLIQKATDMVLAVAIPAHMHITMNACVSDYLPKAARGGLWNGEALPVKPRRVLLASTQITRTVIHQLACFFIPPGPARYVLLGTSTMTFLGLLKLNMISGPGITESIRGLWHRPKKEAPATPAKKGFLGH